jgi:hypothetical protein
MIWWHYDRMIQRQDDIMTRWQIQYGPQSSISGQKNPKQENRDRFITKKHQQTKEKTKTKPNNKTSPIPQLPKS